MWMLDAPSIPSHASCPGLADNKESDANGSEPQSILGTMLAGEITQRQGLVEWVSLRTR
jgi:hypothetical protein